MDESPVDTGHDPLVGRLRGLHTVRRQVVDDALGSGPLTTTEATTDGRIRQVADGGLVVIRQEAIVERRGMDVHPLGCRRREALLEPMRGRTGVRRRSQPVSNVMKTKHDTAKSSISN